MMRVLSDIYPPEIKPVRDGAYLLVWWDGGDGRYEMEMAQWDGHRWHSADGSVMAQRQRWCGLAFDPAAAVQTTNPVRGGRFDGIYGVFVPGATCE